VPPFHVHPVLLMVLAVLGAWHVGTTRSGRYRRRALWGWLVLALVVLWPVGDLAASVSLSVATAQRLVIMLFAAPMFVMSVSTQRLVSLTRPAWVDAVTRRLAHPALSMAVVTVVGTLTLSTPVVDEGARSNVFRVLTLVVVTSLSFVWIFARHSLYPGLHGQHSLLHMTPLLDQQLAGFVAKLGSYLPMWAVAFTIFSRADDAGVAVEETPLHWADVERQLLRIDRHRARLERRNGRGGEGASERGVQ